MAEAPPEAPPRPAPAQADDGYRDRFLPIASWALYDFANTLYAAMVVTLAMPRVLSEATGKEKPMAVAGAAAMLLSALLGPFLGALADATGNTKRQVILWSILCCGLCSALAFVPAGRPLLLMAIFVLSYVAYNIAISLYDVFLPEICTPGRMGFVSGLGVGVGYLGALLGYPVANAVQKVLPYEAIFLAAGILMVLFSLPMFLFVRDRTVARPRPFTVRLGLEELRATAATLRRIPARPALFLFLLGNFLAVDSLNAMIQWVAQFFRKAWNAEEPTVITLLTGLSLSAFLLGVIAGRVADAVGAGRVLFAAVLSLAVVSLVDAFSPSPGVALWVTMVGGGLGASGVWLSSRRMLVDLVPAESLGEYMGILGVTRKASVLGTLMLATLADSFSWRIAVASLSVPLAFSLLSLEGSRRMRAREIAAAA